MHERPTCVHRICHSSQSINLNYIKFKSIFFAHIDAYRDRVTFIALCSHSKSHQTTSTDLLSSTLHCFSPLIWSIPSAADVDRKRHARSRKRSHTHSACDSKRRGAQEKPAVERGRMALRAQQTVPKQAARLRVRNVHSQRRHGSL